MKPILYGDLRSGNCYKVALLASLLEIDFELSFVDVMKGEARSEQFSKINDFQKVPAWQDSNGFLAESNAILNYLAEIHESKLLPADPWLKAQVLKWQFWEQYVHEPAVAVARFICLYQKKPENRLDELKVCQQKSHAALLKLEQHLASHSFLVDNQFSIADISLFAYTHVAEEGEISLDPFPKIQDWLSRVESTSGFKSMAQLKSSLT